MGYKEFFPFGAKSIEIIFKCDVCNHIVKTESFHLPTPNYLAEKASDSHNGNQEDAICDKCNKNFEIDISVGFADAYVEIDDVLDVDIFEIIENFQEDDEYYEDQINSILSGTDYYEIFIHEIGNLKDINDVDLRNSNLQKTLLRQIYSSIISCLEDYLSSTLIREVLNVDLYFKNFVRTNPRIKDRKFNLNDIYEELEKLTDVVKKELVDVIYHDLPKVRLMYQGALKIDFPEIADLMKIIMTRHDMVHRNGKDKDGKIIELNEGIIDDVIDMVQDFVTDIESRIKYAERLRQINI
jgi:transcription elongation factor Elf1